MKAPGIQVVCAVFVIVGLGSSAQASPLDLKHVSARIKWLVHLDADAARTATISERINEKVIEGRPEIKTFVARIHELTGMDFRTDLHDVTVYGKQLAAGNLVVLAHAKFDEVDLLLRAAKARDYKVSEYGNHEIHTLTLNNTRGIRPSALAIYKSDTLIMATSVEDVQAALDVLDGKTANALRSPLAGDVRRGTILSVRLTGLGDAKFPPMLQVLGDASSVSLALGEVDKKTFLDAKGVMASEDAADTATTLLKAAKEFGRLRFADDETSLAVIDDLEIGGEEKTVTISLSTKVDDFWQMVQTAAQKMPGLVRANRREKK